MEHSRAIANRIKDLCEKKGMNYTKLAETCGEPATRIYRVIAGTMSCQAILLLVKICKGLDISLDEFLDTDELKDIFQ